MTFVIVFLILLIPMHFGLYKLFEKAGRKGWEALIPFYNAWVWLKITNRPWYWIVSLPFPGINLITFAAMLVALFKAFGKTTAKDHVLGVIGFAYFVPLWAMDKKVVFIPVEKRVRAPKSKVREWIEAALFAVVAATILKGYFFEMYKIPTPSMEEHLLVGDFLFVSKLNYGTRVPNTPLSIPFMHNSLVGSPTTKSYLEIWEIPYFRFPGFQKIKRNDVVVFNFPVNDTTINDKVLKAFDYYNQVIDRALYWRSVDIQNRMPMQDWNAYMNKGRTEIHTVFPIITRPLDKKENFIKRCVAVAGDKLEMRDGVLYINDEIAERPENVAYSYDVKTKPGFTFNPEFLDEMGIVHEDKFNSQRGGAQTWRTPLDAQYQFNLVLTDVQYEKIKEFSEVLDIKLSVERYDSTDMRHVKLFPNDVNYHWTRDNYGPIVMPSKGDVVNLTTDNMALYRRIIAAYEHHTLEEKGGKFYIDGTETTTYTIEQDYYYLIGDNRHNSLDSRYWGYVPYDHVIGKALFIWMSTNDGNGRFPFNIRWNRIGKLVH